MSYVKTFNSLEDAIFFMIDKSNLKFYEIREQVYDKFGKDAENVNWELFKRSEKLKKLMKK
jgi:S-adenosylmethionine synthetase